MSAIEKIDKLYAKATPGPWIGNEYLWTSKDGKHPDKGLTSGYDSELTVCDGACIAALHNAWPAISAVLKAAHRITATNGHSMVSIIDLDDALTALDKSMKDEVTE